MSAPVTFVTGKVAPLLLDNIDTDAIIPSREIRGVGKTGLADGVFAGWRYRPGTRDPDPDFVLNDPAFADAPILLGGGNFGCGSSREHAVWALYEYGFRAVIAPSFAPIFRANCVGGGIIPVVLDADQIRQIVRWGSARIDLLERTVKPHPVRTEPVEVPSFLATGGQQKNGASTSSARTDLGSVLHFPIDDEAQAMLAEGLDAIDLTLKRAADIAAFHAADRQRRRWIYL